MDDKKVTSAIEIWGGIECSYNRVADRYIDQLDLSGHYTRDDDIERFAKLGLKAMRYPVLWEKHCPEQDTEIDWSHTEKNLNKLRSFNIAPIAGLVHHGSGPRYASFYDQTFAEGVAEYAAKVASRFPWIEYYTPINEPLTTARFCGLYGHWYPHGTDATKFLRILIAECKATVLAMQAIRRINPAAKLLQTEDLGKTHSTPMLNYQANFENERRWLSIDLLCGKVTRKHPLFTYIMEAGINQNELSFFIKNPCPPSILGINHYVTSERYIDENTQRYPHHTWGGNGQHEYADVEAVRVSEDCMAGAYTLFKEAWERFNLPIAITEVHLHCTREEQLRWFYSIWKAADQLKQDGVDIKAVTAWALLGSFEWCTLLTQVRGDYESGLFDIRGSVPRSTALTKLVESLAKGQPFDHPVLQVEGWWKRACRITYFLKDPIRCDNHSLSKSTRPVIITGKTGTLGKAFARICTLRGINHVLLGRGDFDIGNPAHIEKIIIEHDPWAIINTAGFVRVDEAESNVDNCFLVNSIGPERIAEQTAKYNVKFMTFSTDLVFDGKKTDPYLESDIVSPLSVYGQSKARAEHGVLQKYPEALIIRTSAFFGPWDSSNFVANALYSFKHNLPFKVLNDVVISPTYVPDLVNISLDLLLDDESGIWNISNKGELSWAMLANQVAERGGFPSPKMQAVPLLEMGLNARLPYYSVLKTEKGFELPSLDNALERFFYQQEVLTI